MGRYEVYEGEEPYVFISYAHKDTERVVPLIHGLMDRGYRVWYDVAVEPGKEWPTYIAQHLVKSVCAIVFLSANAIDSHNCRQELTMCLEKKKEPVILFLEKVEWNFNNCGTQLQTINSHHLYRENYNSVEEVLDTLSGYRMLRCTKRPEEGKKVPAPAAEEKDRERDSNRAKTNREAGHPGRRNPEPGAGECYRRGMALLKGKGTDRNKENATVWFRKAAERGLPEGMHRFGWCCENGIGTRRNLDEAVKWYTMAAEKGLVQAQYALGLCLERGKGLEVSCVAAAQWYEKAAQKGYAPAQYSLGDCFYRGKGVDQDAREAVKWYRRAAERNHLPGQRALGWCCQNGVGTERNPELGVHWFRRAAAGGHPHAQCDLGNCYARGEGVSQNWIEAAFWYRKAAEQNHAQAQYYLGMCYHHGNGVAHNMREAIKWYTLAAAGGEPRAKNCLDRLK